MFKLCLCIRCHFEKRKWKQSKYWMESEKDKKKYVLFNYLFNHQIWLTEQHKMIELNQLSLLKYEWFEIYCQSSSILLCIFIPIFINCVPEQKKKKNLRKKKKVKTCEKKIIKLVKRQHFEKKREYFWFSSTRNRLDWNAPLTKQSVFTFLSQQKRPKKKHLFLFQ